MEAHKVVEAVLGVVPACRSLGCVSIFAPDVGTASLVRRFTAGIEPGGALNITAGGGWRTYRLGGN